MPNAQEVFLYALLVLQSGQGKKELDQWAGQVLLEEKRAEELGDAWTPPSTPDWTPPKGKEAPLWGVLHRAILGPPGGWSEDELGRIAAVLM